MLLVFTHAQPVPLMIAEIQMPMNQREKKMISMETQCLPYPNKMDTMPQWTIYQFATTPLKAKTLWTPTADQVVLECKKNQNVM